MLRRKGYQGPVTLLTADDSPPNDRPNLSKEFLASPLRGRALFWSQHYDVLINSLDDAERPDSIEIDGRLDGHDCTVRCNQG